MWHSAQLSRMKETKYACETSQPMNSGNVLSFYLIPRVYPLHGKLIINEFNEKKKKYMLLNVAFVARRLITSCLSPLETI